MIEPEPEAQQPPPAATDPPIQGSPLVQELQAATETSTSVADAAQSVDQLPDTFTFNHISGAAEDFPGDGETKELLAKWGVSELMQYHSFRFDQFYQPHMSDQLLLDFVKDPEVQKVWRVPPKGLRGAPQPLGAVSRIRTQPVPSSLTSFSIFDRLSKAGVVREETGSIVKCFDNYIQDMQIQDKLRECLLDEDSENYTLFTDEERDELLLRLFQHCVLGGGMCQYEDEIQPYFKATKVLYKKLLAVRKHEETGKIEVVTRVFSLRSIKAGKTDPALFPSRSPYSFCYLFVNPVKRTLSVWYMPWISLLG